ncbi:acyltransferase family protein [Chelatococcus reniformis]|uniref:Acyltransferase n=1 Tax=Chelatococcus reniformis TaxID=1494448 RepID=A0A916UG37_9HYPH|nr:acyltransferase [Chelatococcus reniformis]GGC72286.1 acyltransferase [Chelatococcus reniformis]
MLEVDGLRALAMIAVVAQHCLIFPPGWAGVWLFYVISGYVITRVLLEEVATAAPVARLRAFVWRRVFRIVPVYLLYIAIAGVIVSALGYASYLRDLPALLTFLYNWQTAIVPGQPVFNHLWSLSVEEQFYLIYPLLFLFLPRRTYLWAIAAIVLCGPLIRAATVLLISQTDLPVERYPWFIYHGSICHFDAFLAGALIANFEPRLKNDRRVVPILIAATIIAALSYLAFCTSWDRVGQVGVFKLLTEHAFPENLIGRGRELFAYSVINLASVTALCFAINGAGKAKLLAFRWLVQVGKISYGGYLYHNLVLWIFITLIMPFPFKDMGVMQRLPWFLVVLAVTVAAAYVSFYRFELPIMQRRRLRMGPRPGLDAMPDELSVGRSADLAGVPLPLRGR